MSERITEKQIRYIEILSSYPSTRAKDLMDIREYLKKVGKKDILELTKREASELIQILLRRPVEYVFPCGKRKFLHKQEVNRINVFGGSFEACIHHCPEEMDVNSCLYWKGYYDGLREEFLSDEVVDEIYGERYRIKCAVCNKYIIQDKRLYDLIMFHEELKDRVTFGVPVKHHVDYDKGIVVVVCLSCHAKIHRDPTHPLYPKNKNNDDVRSK